jgi:ubiquinone/menaquinone biosynthesis C-methylase UbiE
MTHPVNYDAVAPAYDRRYERNRFDGVAAVLRRFVGEPARADVAEVGCGTGHWLAEIRGLARSVAGVDLSAGMLRRARTAAPSARVVRGRAESLPWRSESFDRLFCVNALHHFADADAFMREAHRVLRPGGAIMTVGLDPHTGVDRWWIYDCFPSALTADRARYLSTESIRARLEAAGFVGAATELAQHIPSAIPFDTAVERGVVDRGATSQLMVIGDAEYEDGLRRLAAERPILHADLRLYATVASVRPRERSEPPIDK